MALRDAAGRRVDEAAANGEAWDCDGGELRVGAARFVVRRNLPACRVVLPEGGRPAAGLPLLPLLEHAEFADRFRWRWLRSRAEAGADVDDGGDDEGWEDAGCEERAFTPAADDVGRRLRVECRPSQAHEGGTREGAAAAAETAGPVEPAPPRRPSDGRRQFTAAFAPAPTHVRVLTYNVLANVYAASEKGRAVLFRHVPTPWLDVAYRQQLALQEVLDYKSDVVCLQEVDAGAFARWWEPRMRHAGYSGRFTPKLGGVAEGQAVFVRDARYAFREVRPVAVRELFTEPLAENGLAAVGGLLTELPNLRAALQRLATVATLALLDDRAAGGRPLLVVNTHLYFHPGAASVRTLHVYALLKQVEALLKEVEADGGGGGTAAAGRPAVFFCGDLNSEPDTSAVQLLQEGRVPADHFEWADSAGFVFSKLKAPDAAAAAPNPAPAFTGVDLESPVELASADRLLTGFTNFVPGYAARGRRPPRPCPRSRR